MNQPADLRASFANPPLPLHPRPLWFWNGDLSVEETRRQVEAAVAAGYSGFGVVATREMYPGFMSPGYLDNYRAAVETAAASGATVCLYDDFWFPSGSAAGEIARKAPEALSKRLDLHATVVAGPTWYAKPVPPGALMSAVAMHVDTRERTDLRPFVRDDWFEWRVPEGKWRIMFFTCVTDGAKGLIDYLEPSSVDAFVERTYERYRDRLSDLFGSTIDTAFHDETTFHWVEGGRAWTPGYNTYFEREHGFDPALLYPALWFDIGPGTTEARNLLFGFRATLFGESFIRRINDWCRRHGLVLTGHVDQEEVANPVGLCGDLMKVFEHQDIPAFDQIFFYGRSRKAAKVVSSAAANYGRPLVMCECYGVTEPLEPRDLYREAIDLFIRGTNVLVPHAIWYHGETKDFPPDLSLSDATYGPHVVAFNTWVARMQSMLQQGTPVTDIGVLYPIHSLQAEYRFDGAGTVDGDPGSIEPYDGGVEHAWADYLDVGDRLVSAARRDFTFVHPAVLDTYCEIVEEEGEPVIRLVSGDVVLLFRVFVLPGSTTISLSNIDLLRRFHDAGGRVVATTRLPDRATRAADDEAVRDIRDHIFARGNGVLLPDADGATLRRQLDRLLPDGDVVIEAEFSPPNGHLSYAHRRAAGRDVFLFGNSSDEPASFSVSLRGRYVLEVWDPATGETAPLLTHQTVANGRARTRVDLTLEALQALFVVSTRPR